MIKKKGFLIIAVLLCALTAVSSAAAAGGGLVKGEYRYFKDGEIFVSDTAASGEEITSKISVANIGTESREAALITALYTRDGEMKAADYTGRTLASGERAVLEASVVAPVQGDNSEVYSIRSFLWEGLDSIKPCTQAAASLSEIPTGLSVTDVTASAIGLKWDRASSVCGESVLGYNIYRNGVNIYSTVDTTFTDAGLSDNEKYIYTVKAFGLNGEGISSAPVTAVTENIARVDMTGNNVQNGKNGTDGINIFACGATFQSAFDTEAYADLYSGKGAVYSVGNYYNRICFAGYNTTSEVCGLMFCVDDLPILTEKSDCITFIAEYFDNSLDPVYFTYRIASEGESKTIAPIERRDSQTWKTCVFTVTDAEFDTSDNRHFCFTSEGGAPIYISEAGAAKGSIPEWAVLDADDSTGETGLLSYEHLDIISNNKQIPIINGIETVTDDATHTPAFCLKPADEESGKVPRLSIDVDEAYIAPTDNNVKIRITYWDFVKDARDSYIRIDYAGIAEDNSVAVNTIMPIKLTGTKTWKTAEFIIHNACFNTDDFIIEKPTADYVRSDMDEALYISKIEVIKIT